jgi:hypothetical protein
MQYNPLNFVSDLPPALLHRMVLNPNVIVIAHHSEEAFFQGVVKA